jgi:heat shock protein HtpX
MFKRLGKGFLLLIVTNIAIMLTLGIAMSLLQAAGLMPEGYTGQMMVFCLLYGFGAAFISLAMSRFIAKKFMGVQVIDPQNSGQYDWLVQMVHTQSKAAGLSAMPEVGVYNSPEMNAFATGPSRSRSLVAFSTGILARMSRDEVAGVSAHEVAHIENGDMFAMTLLQGLVNAFALFFAFMIAKAVSSRIEGQGARIAVEIGVRIIAQMLFLALGSIVIAAYSRRREFKADARSARLAGSSKMIAALKALQRNADARIPDEARIPEGVAALGINGRPSKFLQLFATHPPLEARIEALEQMRF